jgi:5-methyltetrahydrofolate--homocysteine methyltransferase
MQVMEINDALGSSPFYDEFFEALRQRVLLMDGGMGTCLQEKNLSVTDFGGPIFEGCNENLNFTQPDIVQDIHEAYFRAGADIVETNTFGATPLVLGEYDLTDKAFEVNRVAAQIAKIAAKTFKTQGRSCWVAGSMGPTTKALSVTGGVTLSELIHSYRVQASGLIQGEVDFLLLETTQDTMNLRAGIEGVFQAIQELSRPTPLLISATIEPTGTMLAGQGVEALCTSLSHLKLLGLGMNCSTGPEFMTSHLRALAELSPFPVFCMPNAGLPNEDGNYDESPKDMGRHLSNFADHGWLNIIGGCCGTSPEYTSWFHELRGGWQPRKISPRKGSFVSGIEFLEIEEANRPLLVGERTNIIGSKKFKKLIIREAFEEAAEVGRKQVKKGGQILDVCLANPDREELEDLRSFLPELVKKVRVPVMIDSTCDDVFEFALQNLPGKCILNSVNLEEGEARFERVSGYIRRHGGALVVGCIDEDPDMGMAVTTERKLEIAKRSHKLLTEKYGLPEEDLIFDPLVFPCGTGDENYVTSARETVSGLRKIKAEFPRCKTILGISNVSFGLPPAGREVLNSVFLFHCTKAGLDLAIVNTEKIERLSTIGEAELKLAEKLIFENSPEAVEEFANYFRDRKPKIKSSEMEHLSVEERLKICLVEGTKEGLIPLLDKALKKYSPLEVINQPLMDGMNEVGRLFNDNQLIVAEVLQSAGVMKASVTYLETLMEQGAGGGSKAKFLLATVKGDVHDIGKNLVDMIFGNNGYEIINLGIKVVPEKLIEAFRKHKPDYIGLSGLLVKSALEMVNTAEDLKMAGISVPLFVGGAALSRSFCDRKIAPCYDGPVLYAVDAMTGLEMLNSVTDPKKRADFLETYSKARVGVGSAKAPIQRKPVEDEVFEIFHLEKREQPQNFERQFFELKDLKKAFEYINEQFFYTQHLGFKGSIKMALKKKDEKALRLRDQVEGLKDEVIRNHWFDCRGVFQFFKAASFGDQIQIFSEDGQVLEKIDFPRQKQGKRLCGADFLGPLEKPSRDSMAIFALSPGSHYREVGEKFKRDGDFLNSHLILALAVETAEALAELAHIKIREQWGISEDLSISEVLRARYQGIRLSFGYPACPNLDNQEKIFRLIKPQDIGLTLTESMMMEPEASVSALVFSHPQARYFQTDH